MGSICQAIIVGRITSEKLALESYGFWFIMCTCLEVCDDNLSSRDVIEAADSISLAGDLPVCAAMDRQCRCDLQPSAVKDRRQIVE